MKTALAVAGALVVAACFLAGSFVWGWLGGVYRQTATPERAVERYEWYEQQLRDIEAAGGQCRDAEGAAAEFKKDNGPPAEWRFDQRGEYARLLANSTGLKQARRKLVEDYNARAAMVTRNLWKRPDLPQHLEE